MGNGIEEVRSTSVSGQHPEMKLDALEGCIAS